MEQQDLHKRLLLALSLSFVVLIGFSYFTPTTQISDQNKTVSSTQASATTSNNAPLVETNTANTPTKKMPTASISSKSPAKTQTIIAKIQAKNYVLEIDKFGRIGSAKLLKDKYRDEEENHVELFNPNEIFPLEVRFGDATLNDEAFKTPYTADQSTVAIDNTPATVTLTQKLSTLTLTKKLTFYPDGHYDIDISSDKKASFFLTPGHRPDADHSRYMLVRGALVRNSDGIITTIEDGDMEKSLSIPNATIVSAFDRYDASMFYDFTNPMSVTMSVDKEDNPLSFVQIDSSSKLHGYIGAKEWNTLEAIHPELTNAVEFGWFTFLSKPFFKVMLWIHNYVGNWGWAIILFTLLVKLVLFPLSYKGMMSMQKLKDLAPKMKELKEKYGKDPAKMNQQMMELYKKHGANPMGGCLPMLLQIPVFFALYRVLLNADEMQGAPWIGWIVNLADKDPYYILPILMGASMFLQQKITPNTMTDPLQQKIFQYFPVIMTFFFLTFPAGLVLYWFTNNVLSIAQQYYINRAYEKYKLQMKVEHNKSVQKG